MATTNGMGYFHPPAKPKWDQEQVTVWKQRMKQTSFGRSTPLELGGSSHGNNKLGRKKKIEQDRSCRVPDRERERGKMVGLWFDMT